MTAFLFLFISAIFIVNNEASKILAVFPTPSISHQIAFRPLVLELVNRGHQVTVITTDPLFKGKDAPANLTEVDVHDLSYDIWLKEFISTKVSSDDHISLIIKVMIKVFEKQIKSDVVQRIITDKSLKFDLLILEAYFTPLLGLSHVFKVPVIQISSLGSVEENLRVIGAVSHPLLYPTCVQQKVYNLTMWEKVHKLYKHYQTEQVFKKFEDFCNEKMSEIFGADTPPLDVLRNNVDMLFLNIHAVWERNRPVPPNVIFMGGVHQKPEKELPQELKTYLDSSKHGVIYISFGTNIEPSLLPPEKIQAITNVVSKLPYDVLWKWNKDELPGRTPNIRISKWFPQADLLRHPKVKLFIMQGGLQSTDEAITAGVPLIGMPMLGDQWFNVEQYVYHKIGLKVDMDTITENKFSNAVNTVLNDESYRQNIQRLRTLMYDQPQTSIERAIWWTEYVIRHSGAGHLRPPSANMPLHQYYELELVAYVVLALITVIFLTVVLLYCTCRIIFKGFFFKEKVKYN